jgi:glycosyltransferase involved in cell wall biosynthesis
LVNVATVLRLITRLNIGGPARQALLLTKALCPQHRTILAAGDPSPEEGLLVDPEVQVAPLDLRRPLAPAADLRAFAQIRQLVRDERPDLVHTHMAKAGTLGRLATWSVDRRTRRVHTYHGHVLEGYFRPSMNRAFLEAERRLARITDVIVAISPEIRDELLDLGIGRPQQYRVIPLGFDLAEHRAVSGHSGAIRSQLGLGDEVPLVGIVGRLVPIKDHRTALRALSQVPNAHLAIVGDGEMRSAIEAFAGEIGIASRVHFLGWRMDIPQVMADLDVVLLTSQNEGTPVSLIEAGACGRAVVATDVGGVRSVVQHEASGFLAPPGDHGALAGRLRELLTSPDLRAAFGRTGRAHTRSFSDERLVADISALYEELLDSPRDSSRRLQP